MPSKILEAVYRNRQDDLASLLATGPALTICDAAAGRAAVPIVAQLLAQGAQVNATQSGGFTALHEAAFKNDLELAELLLAHGADPGLRTNDGETPAAIATRLEHAQLARRLRGEVP